MCVYVLSCSTCPEVQVGTDTGERAETVVKDLPCSFQTQTTGLLVSLGTGLPCCHAASAQETQQVTPDISTNSVHELLAPSMTTRSSCSGLPHGGTEKQLP